MKDPLPTQRRRDVVYSAYVGQSGRQIATHMEEHQSAVRRQGEDSLLALHCPTTGHAFDGTRASTKMAQQKELGSLLKPGKQHRGKQSVHDNKAFLYSLASILETQEHIIASRRSQTLSLLMLFHD